MLEDEDEGDRLSVTCVIFTRLIQKCACVQTVQVAADKFVQDELVDRLNSINERLNTLRVESEEVRHTCDDSLFVSQQNVVCWEAGQSFWPTILKTSGVVHVCLVLWD